jgi:hypothetical protein
MLQFLIVKREAVSVSHPYFSEKTTREAFIKRTSVELQDILSRDDVHRVLGSSAIRLQAMADTMYTPEVTSEGLIRLTTQQSVSDDLPVLALRPNEQLRRDKTFLSFGGRQFDHIPDERLIHLNEIVRRMLAGPEEAFMTQTFAQEDCTAVTMRLMCGLPGYPKSDVVTYFNFRPLVLVEFDPDKRAANAPQLINALTMADKVIVHPVTTVPSPEALDTLHAEWSAAGVVAEVAVRGLIQP